MYTCLHVYTCTRVAIWNEYPLSDTDDDVQYTQCFWMYIVSLY